MQRLSSIALRYIKAAYLLLPFVFWPIGYENFETPKVTLFIIFSFLFSLFAINQSKSLVQTTFKAFLANKFVLLFSLFIGSLFVSSLLGANFKHSLYGTYTRMDGLLLYGSLLVLAFGVYIEASFSQNFKNKIVNRIVYVGALVALISVIKFGLTKLGVIPTEDLLFDGREVGTLGQPNFLGGYLSIVFALTTLLTTINNKKKLLINTVLLIGIAITFSKSSIIVVVLTCGYLAYKKVRIKPIYMLVGAIVLVTIYAALLNSSTYKKLHRENKNYALQRLTSILDPNLVVNSLRTDIYVISLKAAKNRPLLGYGLGNLDAAVFQLDESDEMLQNFGILDSSHNIFIDILVHGGIISLVAYIAFVISFIITAISNRRFDFIFVLLLMLVRGMTNITPFVLYAIQMLMIGLLATENSKKNAESTN